jgi:squalene synthase HpnC
MAVNHYENFPVASILMPRRLVPAVEAIYAFARSADDLADEGDAAPGERLAALQAYDQQLDRIEAGGVPDEPMFARLAGVVAQYRLSVEPMRDLLSAFRQDVVTPRYQEYASLLDYCRRSANPVGRLMLALYEADDAVNLRDSDAICSALQLINFIQDVAIDLTKGRIYLPLEDLARFKLSETALKAGVVDAPFQALMRFEVERARALMLSGAPLARRLPGRIGWELRMIVQGGLRILDRIERAGYDVFRRRPTLATADWVAVGWGALRM